MTLLAFIPTTALIYMVVYASSTWCHTYDETTKHTYGVESYSQSGNVSYYKPVASEYANGTSDAVSALLDHMLENYDQNLRPNFGGNPLTVAVEFNIRSIGPITEQDMLFSMECYFRQRWRDERLTFDPGLYGNNSMYLTLNVKMLDRIWLPDTVIVNGQRSYLHTIPMPNRFFRVHADGLIYYSQRLTIRTRCPMRLEKFPMDSQECPLLIGSFGYAETDMRYVWRNGEDMSVEIAEGMKLSQFDLISHPSYNSSAYIRGGLMKRRHAYMLPYIKFTCNLAVTGIILTGYVTILGRQYAQHSLLEVRFILKRRTGYFMLQVYLPCSLLVILSWVSFWINREATSDRISLGVTTVLTITFLGIDNRVDLPKVDYSTALDVYLVMCFTFVLATVIQFAIVHRFTKTATGNQYPSVSVRSPHDQPLTSGIPSTITDVETPPVLDVGSKHQHITAYRLWSRLISCHRSDRIYTAHKSLDRLNSVSLIDRASRVIFPLAFTVFNIVYWVSYADF